MELDEGLAVSERLGLLLAICERERYVAAGEAVQLTFPYDSAVERYGVDGLPKADTLAFVRWGRQPLIAGLLTEPRPEAALPYLRCATVAQQSLGLEAVDMLVILFGPLGSNKDAAWGAAAAAIEDDDRICRKLVWLPDDDATRNGAQFVARSPFARPWRGSVPMADGAGQVDALLGEIDPLFEVAYRAASRNATSAEFLDELLERGAA